MGWRFRKSIGGKYFRVNLGKHGVNSVTFGARGMPHVTTGRTGTRVGASIPGTGIYYTHKIGEAPSNTSSDAPVTQHIDTAPTTSFPAQTQTAVLPPPGGGTPANTGMHGNNHPLPWSRLALSALILGLLALACFAFNGYAAAILFSLAALPLGIAGLIVIQLRKSRHSALLAVGAIILSMSMLVASVMNMPTAQGAASTATNSISANQKAARLAKQKAAQQQGLDSTAAAAAAAAQAKAKADADAAAKAEAEQRQQTPQNTQQQTQQPQFQATQQAQQQNSSGSLVAVCSDGTRSYSSPGASDYLGMCSHHHGIAQKLGRQ